MDDLAPAIFRQRVVIEGTPTQPINDYQIRDYLTTLSTVLDMTALITPVTHRSPAFGWAGWIHWETSGAHLYAWDTPLLFLSVDVYTCKPFDTQTALQFTADYFHTTTIVAKDI